MSSRFLLALAAVSLAGPRAHAENGAPPSEQMQLESARYLFDIEGDATAAHRLLDRLSASNQAEIRIRVQYLRGIFLEREGKPEQAVEAFSQALIGGLSPSEKRRVYARLLALSPGSVQPLRGAGRSQGRPARVFAGSAGGATQYVLVEDSEKPESPPRIYWQDSEGMLRGLEAALSPGEEVLDGTPDVLLTVLRARQEVFLRRAPAFTAQLVAEKFTAESGLLFPGSGEAEEFLLVGGQGLRLMRRDRVLFSYALPGPGCGYLPSSLRSRQGVLFCPAQGVFRADFSRRTVAPLVLGTDPPAEAVLSGDYLAIRNVDHVEIRRGPGFEAFLWGFPAELQDQFALGREHAFLLDGQGHLKAFLLRTGQVDWQRDDAIAEIHPVSSELFALTYGRVCLAADDKGRTLFSYEAGWGSEPLLLPTRDWLVVHQANGRRVRINRELLRVTGGDRDFLLRGAQERLKRRDATGALRELDSILELEPGNGAAWKEKAQILKTAGAGRKETSEAWLQMARSQGVQPWSDSPALRNLAHAYGAGWMWKRRVGPRFFPSLTAGADLSFYVENDNQTLVLLDNVTGALKNSFHFPEPLDLKAACWIGDTVAVSSPARLYLLTPAKSPGITPPIPLRNPICQALPVQDGLVFSDWSGNLQFLELPSRRVRWEKRLGRNGLLLARGRNAEVMDVFEIEGGYHGIHIPSGKSVSDVRLPPGTITESHAGRDFAFAGYNEGLLLAVDRAKGIVAWQKDMGEQIFSMTGKGDQTLLLSTASKRILSVSGATGAAQSETQLSTYLFNRPVLVDDGYWVGTTAPALEKRSWSHALLQRLPLTDMPGTPSLVGDGIAIATLDHFILFFPTR